MRVLRMRTYTDVRGTGRCRNCSCVKAGNPCQNCFPSRLGYCSNSSPPIPAISLTVTTQPLADPAPQPQQEVPQQNVPQQTVENNPDHRHPLPNYTATPIPNFCWGDMDRNQFTCMVDQCYNQIVHWKRNLFKVPSGKAGIFFVRVLSRLFQAYADCSALETVALKAAMTMPSLLLQKPHSKSKA